MATKITVPITTVSPTAAGQTTTISLPLGRTYHEVWVEYRESGSLAATADLEAAITGVRVKVNGRQQWGNGLSAADLNVINTLNGMTPVNGYLQFPFSAERARTIEGDEGNAIGTANLSSFEIELEIASDATTPTIAVMATYTEEARNLVALRKIRKQNVVSGGAADLDVTTLDKRDVYKRIHARSSLVTAGKVEIDGKNRFEMTNAQCAIAYGRRPVPLAPVSNNFHFVFDADDRADSGWGMLKPTGAGTLREVDEFRVTLTCSGSGTVPLVIETYGPPN